MDVRVWSEMQDVLLPLSAGQREALAESIRERGVQQPVLVLPDGRIIDGHHRWELSGGDCPVEVRDVSDDEGFALGLELNTARRQLTPEQWREVRGSLVARALVLRGEGVSQQGVADELGVSRRTVDHWEDTSNVKVDNACIPDLRVSVPKAQHTEIAKKVRAGETQAQVAADYGISQQRVAQIVRKADAAQRRPEESQRRVEALPSGTYSIVYADPPWRYEFAESETRKIENQYPTMTLDEIKALSVPAAPDSVLFLWATSPKLAEAIEVVAAWGFEYVTCAVWVKDSIGLGYYFRQQHEILLVGKRGKLPLPEPNVRPSSLISAKRGRHSEKPQQVYDLIESMYPHERRIEMFARNSRDGWDNWGNEGLNSAA